MDTFVNRIFKRMVTVGSPVVFYWLERVVIQSCRKELIINKLAFSTISNNTNTCNFWHFHKNNKPIICIFTLRVKVSSLGLIDLTQVMGEGDLKS